MTVTSKLIFPTHFDPLYFLHPLFISSSWEQTSPGRALTECWLDHFVDLTSLEPSHLLKAFFLPKIPLEDESLFPVYNIWSGGMVDVEKNLGGSISLCSAALGLFDLAAGAKRWVAEEPGCFEDQMPVSTVRVGNVQITTSCWHLFKRASR